MNAKKGQQLDHISDDRSDNRRCNLRFCTKQQNLYNRKKSKHSQYEYKGIWYEKERKRWRARLYMNYKRINLGRYKTKVEAARAYDKAATKYYGKFARLNFPF